MEPDRAIQRDLLKRTEATYPAPVIFAPAEQEDAALLANAYYLQEHGLLKCVIAERFGAPYALATATITADGIDFLADDGGLSAILGVVTIKLHEDTLLQMLESRIQQSAAPTEQKSALMLQLRALPGESIKHLTMKLLDLGLQKAPDALQLLQTALQAVLK